MKRQLLTVLDAKTCNEEIVRRPSCHIILRTRYLFYFIDKKNKKNHKPDLKIENLSKMKNDHLKSSQVKSSQVKSSQVKSSQVKSSQVKSRS